MTVGYCLFFMLFIKMEIAVSAMGLLENREKIFAGAAQIDITPKEPGYPHYRGPSTGVSDPLYAKAMVLRSGNQHMALVVCDLLWIERDLSSKVRMQVSQHTDIPYANILISGTHTHTGPAYHPNIRELTGTLRPPNDREDKLEGDAYPDWLAARIAESIITANANLEEVYLEAGMGQADDISFNRRFLMHDGKVRTNPGVGNPEIVRSVGPIDPEVGILLLRRVADHTPIASLTNFAVHADTFGGTQFGADYPGFLATALSEALGNGFVSVFGAGACGDLNHVDVHSSTRLSSEEIGIRLSKTIIEKIPDLERLDQQSLGTLSEHVYAPPQAYTAEEWEWASRDEGEPIYEETAFLERRRRLKIRSLERIRRTEAVPPTIGTEDWKLPLEVQVFSIGKELAIVGLPGEVFVELGLAIKNASPFKTTMIIELTHSHIAYVPTLEAFSQGSYETVNSRLAPGGGEMMVESAITMLNRLYEK